MAITTNNETVPLKYLFTALYEDGTLYEQGSEDKSTQEDGKNAYFDIFYKPFKPLEQLVEFSLVGEGHKYTVNLKDGHFEIDGLPFQPYDNLPDVPECRLIFFKQHTHDFNLSYEQLNHRIQFFIGWQATIAGKNFKHMIGID